MTCQALLDIVSALPCVAFCMFLPMQLLSIPADGCEAGGRQLLRSLSDLVQEPSVDSASNHYLPILKPRIPGAASHPGLSAESDTTASALASSYPTSLAKFFSPARSPEPLLPNTPFPTFSFTGVSETSIGLKGLPVLFSSLPCILQ